MSLTGACPKLASSWPCRQPSFTSFFVGEPLLDAQGGRNALECDILINVSLHIYLTVIPSRFLAFAVTLELATGDRTMQQDVPLTP